MFALCVSFPRPVLTFETQGKFYKGQPVCVLETGKFGIVKLRKWVCWV